MIFNELVILLRSIAVRFRIYYLLVFYSDLALRNCLLTSDLTVRIGDYGLSHNHYKVLQYDLFLFSEAGSECSRKDFYYC